jgi:hypothetical protein
LQNAPNVIDERPRWHLGTREIALIAAFWLSLALLSVLNRLFDPRGDGLRVIRHTGPLLLPFIEAGLWAVLTPLVFALTSRTSAQRSRAVRIAVLAASGILIILGLDVVLELARSELLPRRRGGGFTFAPLRGMGRFRLLNHAMLFGAVLAAGLAREYFLRDRDRQRTSTLLEARTAQLEAQLAIAKLDALRMQINPHFLFNTLHGISALVERDPSGVRRMIARLSELLRRTLDSRGSDEVPLREELAFLQQYLDIMAVRFQGRLAVETTVEPATTEALVPNFILQPLVENALEHGVSRTTGAADIAIIAAREGDQLVLSVLDRGPGPGEANEGVGLANTRARLAAMYGDVANVTVVAAATGGTAATIRLPFHLELRA